MFKNFVQATEKTSVVVLMAVNDIVIQGTIPMSERAMGGQPGRARQSAKNGARHLPSTIKDANPAPGRPSARLGVCANMMNLEGWRPAKRLGGVKGINVRSER